MSVTKGNLIISLIGLIERMSYYMMISILFLYLDDKEFILEQTQSLYRHFMFGIYYFPILMGLIADLTHRKKVIFVGLFT